jgi:hypothetical protein
METKTAALIIAKKAWTLKTAIEATIKAILRAKIGKGPKARKGKGRCNIGGKMGLLDRMSLYE